MAQLWGGRFTKQTDDLTRIINDSIGFDKRLWEEDISGSIVHASMLGKQGIVSEEAAARIKAGLESIRDDIDGGRLQISEDYEDIHSFVEAELIRRIGDDGKKLHTGRSRNDQVALDMRLYIRKMTRETERLMLQLENTVLGIMENGRGVYMPGFTHLQKAQPVTLAHHFGAYFEMFRRDIERIRDCRERLNYCPLGAGALAGTTYPLDRDYVAASLCFYAPTANSMDSVSDRDYVIEYLSVLSILMMHLSRLSEEVIIWNSNEYRFVEIDDAYSTGSSIMPQKKNPDVAELIRGKTGRIYGDLFSLLTTMKGIPLAYDKDMQEDKEAAFDAIDSANICIRLMDAMLGTMKFNAQVMAKSAMNGFTNATDAADYLVKKGVPFRDAHAVIGNLVLYCIGKDKGILELTPEELRSFSEYFDEDLYDAVSLESCVERRMTKGAPGSAAMEEEIRLSREWLDCACGGFTTE